MVQAFLITTLLFITTNAKADFFGFGSDGGKFSSQLPGLIEKVKGMKLSADPAFEEEFNKTIQALENRIEEEKLFCAGEAQDDKGNVLPKEQKQLCFRELKKNYLEAVGVIFDVKKKYLGVLHTRQLERLSEIQKQQEKEIEKSF